MKRILVVGSLNMDLVTSVKRRPLNGETIQGEHFFTTAGGKGANQAFAAAKLGGNVLMVGSVGDDNFGLELKSALKAAHVDIEHVQTVENISTGIASITLDDSGENSIIVVSGANNSTNQAYIAEQKKLIESVDAILVQLETPLEGVEELVRLASQAGKKVFLDPAPARVLSDELLSKVDYILPNETEIQQLTNVVVTDLASAEQAAGELFSRGVKHVIAKLGKKGVVSMSQDETIFVEGIKVNTLDTTGAGDAFAGGFIKHILEGNSLEAATRYANAVGAFVVTHKGAQVDTLSHELVTDILEEERDVK